jgi:hypothetical protein
MKQSLEEQVVDVNANVVVIEGQVKWAGVLDSVNCFVFPHCPWLSLDSHTIQEGRPTLLQESKEGLSVGNDFVERPSFKQTVLSEHLDKSLVKDGRYPLTPVVTAQ